MIECRAVSWFPFQGTDLSKLAVMPGLIEVAVLVDVNEDDDQVEASIQNGTCPTKEFRTKEDRLCSQPTPERQLIALRVFDLSLAGALDDLRREAARRKVSRTSLSFRIHAQRDVRTTAHQWRFT